jgi:uncharacterized protein YdcH (DUF465 family)
MLHDLKRSDAGKSRVIEEQNKVDSKIKTNPLQSSGGFSDARQEKVTLVSGSDKWAGKQSY